MKFTIWNTDFSFKDNAYRSIEGYISEIRKYFKTQNDENSITDIEFAIADKFEKILAERTDKILVLSDVEKIILELGSVEMISDEEVVLQEESSIVVWKKLYRDADDTVIAGVCSWLGHYFWVDAWLVRLLFIAAFFTPIPSIIPYLILWFILPLTQTKSDEFRMRWIPVSLSSLSKESENFTVNRTKSLVKAVIILFITFVLFAISIAIIGFALFQVNGGNSTTTTNVELKTEKLVENE